MTLIWTTDQNVSIWNWFNKKTGAIIKKKNQEWPNHKIGWENQITPSLQKFTISVAIQLLECLTGF